MTKPSPIAVVALCIVAVSILAFTINDQFSGRKNSVSHKSAVSKNANIISPIVTRNPPHGQPGHRHDLPDGAPLPIEGAPETPALTSNNLSLTSPTLQSSGENIANALNPEHGKPGHVCGVPVGAPLNSAQANQNTGAVIESIPPSGKNPAHGQPGHRCDIAVGASLDSSPAPAAVATTGTSTPNPKTVPAASGLNPAHGQPGHRCDIAVGASLNSAPATAAVTTTGTSTPDPKTATSASGLNPAHGQPGHRCDIAVGASLNSSPSKTPIVTTSSAAPSNQKLNPSIFPNYNFTK